MNRTCFRTIVTWMFMAGVCQWVHAGALVTQEGSTLLGNLKENGNAIVLACPHGSMTFDKSRLRWYTMDPSVNTWFKAVEKALIEDQPSPLVHKLLDASIQQEPTTRTEARRIQERLQASKAQEFHETATTAALWEPSMLITQPREPLMPFDSLSLQGSKLNPIRPVVATVSFGQTEFQGFINYETYAVSNGQLFTFKIPQPIFSKSAINTTVVLDGGGGGLSLGGHVGGQTVRVRGFGFGGN